MFRFTAKKESHPCWTSTNLSPALPCPVAQLHQLRSPGHVLHKEQLSLGAGASGLGDTWPEVKNNFFFPGFHSLVWGFFPAALGQWNALAGFLVEGVYYWSADAGLWPQLAGPAGVCLVISVATGRRVSKAEVWGQWGRRMGLFGVWQLFSHRCENDQKMLLQLKEGKWTHEAHIFSAGKKWGGGILYQTQAQPHW